MNRIPIQGFVIIPSVVPVLIIPVVRLKDVKKRISVLVFHTKLPKESCEISGLPQFDRIRLFHKIFPDDRIPEIVAVGPFMQSGQNSSPACTADWGTHHSM